MNRMIRLRFTLAILFCISFFVFSVAPDSPAAVALDEWAGVLRASHPATSEAAELIDLLPQSTLLAVEVRDLANRWSDIRALPAIRRFQDHVLAESGLSPDDLLRLAGERAVLALVVNEDDRSVMPLALLRPGHLDEAEMILRSVTGPQGESLTTRRGDGALWVGPAKASARLAALAVEGGRSPLSEQIRQRPSERSLVRGWLDPAALRALLRDRVEGVDLLPIDIGRSSVVAALDAVRIVELTRDVTRNGVVTEATIEIDPTLLPAEVARAFASAPDLWPVLPSPLPPGVVLASSFPIEAEAHWAWLRNVAAGDPRGPLRNFDFWTDEFRERYERDLERDLVGALGERGWFFLLEGETNERLQAVLLLEAQDAARVEATLLDLRSWLVELARARTLGLLAPRVWDARWSRLEAHGLTSWVPFAELPGPAFLVTSDHLVLGTGEVALRTGLNLLQTRDTWASTRVEVHAGSEPPHESLRVSGPTLSRWIEAVIEPRAAGGSDPRVSAWLDLLADLEGVSIDAWYEEDAIRIGSLARFD